MGWVDNSRGSNTSGALVPARGSGGCFQSPRAGGISVYKLLNICRFANLIFQTHFWVPFCFVLKGHSSFLVALNHTKGCIIYSNTNRDYYFHGIFRFCRLSVDSGAGSRSWITYVVVSRLTLWIYDPLTLYSVPLPSFYLKILQNILCERVQ